MDFDEYISSFHGKKKKRKLVDIDVDEITLCGSPANQKTFFITKMGAKMDEFFKAIELFLDDAIGKAEVDETKLKRAMKTLLAYKSDFPDDIKSSLDLILKWATKQYGYPTQKSRKDDFPSIPLIGPVHILDKMAGVDEDEDGDEDDDELVDEWG